MANIQFNTKLEKMWDGKATPLRSDAPAMSAGTRSIVWPFNDPELKRQWHYINKGDKAVAQTAREGADINVEEAWKLTAGDPKIIVAVVDEGVKYTHPDLAANMWVNTREMTGTTASMTTATVTWMIITGTISLRTAPSPGMWSTQRATATPVTGRIPQAR